MMRDAAAAPKHQRTLVFLPLIAALNITCGDSPVAPPAVASIQVQSSIGTRLAMGRTATLTATARDNSGNEITGVTITATGNGIAGTINIVVSNPDFAGITTTRNDALVANLTAGMTTAVRTRTQTALDLCTSGVSAGNFSTIEACVAGVRTEASGATDPTDRALLATLALLIDHIDRLLDL